MTSHHGHQSSFEGIIHFSSRLPLEENKRARAKRKFYHIINHFEATSTKGSINPSDEYNRPKLIRLIYEYARSAESQDIFLQAFAQALELSMDHEDDVDFGSGQLEEPLGSALYRFADHLFDHFFLPLRASTKKTPQPSPAYHSAIQQAQGGGVQDFVGTPGRLSELRGDCLIRGRNRCVISRRFDVTEATRRIRRNRDDAADDDGNKLGDESHFEDLEHPLKKAALGILNMFDNGVIHLIEGDDIDRPRNALTLTHNLHLLFGNFEVFFQPLSDAEPHTYQIHSFLPPPIVRGLLPVTRTLFLTENRTIEPPSRRLLELHCAIAHILHLSAAGAYIDKLLDIWRRRAYRQMGRPNWVAL
ncbi:Uncharacterized protein SAPIO_CDS5603 [Scedosporium apiospermum]|uniref:HNH nuclease domain-containing protein n=1 Tax=Pseudallescheria apiosperma TaxID=563466 RepID=A0A084G503_PSEDA|nr:Uncharacterized protein SAPIO_CDS5603 [Scedosporium apiospermum]KEZ42415.1 Uncharacterized protein SAPIO_CDS5603 [Scedosporium apiospermum]